MVRRLSGDPRLSQTSPDSIYHSISLEVERAKRRLDEEEALEQQRELEQQAVGEQNDVLNEEDDSEVFEDETKETETENPDQSFSDSIVAKYLDGSFDQPQVTYSLKLSDE